jgi:hypothetical protein
MTVWTWRFGVSLWLGDWMYPIGLVDRRPVYRRRFAARAKAAQ